MMTGLPFGNCTPQVHTCNIYSTHFPLPSLRAFKCHPPLGAPAHGQRQHLTPSRTSRASRWRPNRTSSARHRSLCTAEPFLADVAPQADSLTFTVGTEQVAAASPPGCMHDSCGGVLKAFLIRATDQAGDWGDRPAGQRGGAADSRRDGALPCVWGGVTVPHGSAG